MRVQNPLIGIWWDDGSQCFLKAHPPNENFTGTNIIHSELNHADVWPEAARYFGLCSSEEYFSIPRGRVAIVDDKKTGIIFHGRTTATDRLSIIANRFGLTNWQTCLDTHYLTGSDTDRLFDDDHDDGSHSP